MTVRRLFFVLVVQALLWHHGMVNAQEPGQKFAPLAPAEAPIIMCIDDKSTPGGQPTDHAYARVAANGFRSILTFRSNRDGVNTLRERLMVEKHKLRFYNLPVRGSLPTYKQIDEFLALLRDKNNHPMLVNCGFIERVAPYMMMFRLIEQGWSEERALDEASRSGLRKDELKKFARGYLALKSADRPNSIREAPKG